MSHVYLQRYAYPEQLIASPPSKNLEIVVVIPCFEEPDLIATLESLANCHKTVAAVEVIVIINESEQAPSQVQANNQQSLQAARHWVQQQDSSLKFHVLYQQLTEKHAGVGLARKLGMDEAVRRFETLNHKGVIVALDADCTVAPNYLLAIETHFEKNPQTPGCAIYYEHPLSGALNDKVYEGIAAYELHLRYYTHALRYTGHPYAFQTVGSSMAVRSDAYQKQGGMNKRQAGEDFYFLQNIFLLGNFTELRNTAVFPSPRPSHRVPFGTGKAMSTWMQEKSWLFLTYNPQTFKDLKDFISKLPELNTASIPELWQSLSPALQGFLPIEKFKEKLSEIRQYSASEEGFRKRFFAWCNGFFVFKFAHFARDHYYPNVPINEAASWLFQDYYKKDPADNTVDMLLQYRALDKEVN